MGQGKARHRVGNGGENEGEEQRGRSGVRYGKGSRHSSRRIKEESKRGGFTKTDGIRKGEGKLEGRKAQ